MKLHVLGIGYRHDSDFLIDRPCGSGDNLILIFKTAAMIKLNNNVIHAPPNTAVVYSPEFCQHYGADGGEYIDHWVHFDAGNDTRFFRSIGLNLNTLLYPADISAAEHVLDLLSLESVSGGRNSAECIDLLLRLLLTKLADGAEQGAEATSQHSGALKELRASIYRSPAEFLSIDMLAQRLSLSPSHFQHLYKQEFGVSCYEDILSARHSMAKYYLRSTTLPIARIAELCGYENDVHFIRQFKKRAGMTAGEYRHSSHS
ncbi:MAG: helix-turn-helix transcriptional regulator [Oscillospiraceae bacterium]